jgi:hypothetical protein
VLGLGGWFVGVLLVMTTMPGTPFGDPLLATLSVGLPIGLCVYWAWVHRDWSMKAKAAGFAAAGVGALAGAWLGYQAAADLLALITAIVGATAGANLILLVFDISWDRRARDRFVETNEKEVLKASLSTR